MSVPVALSPPGPPWALTTTVLFKVADEKSPVPLAVAFKKPEDAPVPPVPTV